MDTCIKMQGCPFCAKVREVVSILDLDVIFYPCPRGTTRECWPHVLA